MACGPFQKLPHALILIACGRLDWRIPIRHNRQKKRSGLWICNARYCLCHSRDYSHSGGLKASPFYSRRIRSWHAYDRIHTNILERLIAIRHQQKILRIGNILLFVTNLVPVFLSTYIAQIPASAVFSVASFFLFLAVLPLMYAPETLPEKKIRLRQLRGYVEKAKKAREKYSKKTDAAS